MVSCRFNVSFYLCNEWRIAIHFINSIGIRAGTASTATKHRRHSSNMYFELGNYVHLCSVSLCTKLSILFSFILNANAPSHFQSKSKYESRRFFYHFYFGKTISIIHYVAKRLSCGFLYLEFHCLALVIKTQIILRCEFIWWIAI